MADADLVTKVCEERFPLWLMMQDVTKREYKQQAEFWIDAALPAILAGLRAGVEGFPHFDTVDPNGRPRPCPEVWPGGRCNCVRGQFLALIDEAQRG